MYLPSNDDLILARRDSEGSGTSSFLKIVFPVFGGVVVLAFLLGALEGWFRRRTRGKQTPASLASKHRVSLLSEDPERTLIPPIRPEPAALIPARRVRGYARIGSMDDILSSNVEHSYNQRSQLASTNRVEPPGSSRSASSDGDISSNLPEYRSRFTGDTTPPEYRSNGSQSTHRSSWL